MVQKKIERGADPYLLGTGRSPAMGMHGAVASPHYLASQYGLEILKRGGHAVDAAIAMNATLCTVYNHMAGLGGDMFCQVWDRETGKVEALNGSGRSGRSATVDYYKDKGMDEIPKRGPLSAITVPGVVDAWTELHQRYGRVEWNELFRYAIEYAENGFAITRKFRDYIDEYAKDTLCQFQQTADIYLPGGKPPGTGKRFVQRDLANSLRMIAEQGTDVFYRGELADRMISALQTSGGLLTKEDFAEHRSNWVEPVGTNYRGLRITELPPNTQGVATLMILNIIEKFDLSAIGDNTADFYHLMTEAVKAAFTERDTWITDPAFMDIPVDRLVSRELSDSLRELIDMEEARPQEAYAQRQPVKSAADGGGDTTYMCAVDADGNACSLIQSIYFEFGSAFIPDGTGILLQNRGSFFKLDSEHPNRLEPEKRTFHTIIPAMALKDDKPFMVFGSMGGEGQPQTQTAMLTRIVDFGYDIQQAIEAPRWLYGRTWGEASKSLKLEGRIPDMVAIDLARRGHDVNMTEDWSQRMGHAQAIVVDQESGVLQAGADPRGDGIALAW